MSFLRKPAFQPAPVITPAPRARGLAAEILAVAAGTSDPLARAALNAIAPRVARMERTLDELVADAMAEAHAAQGVLQ